MRIADTVYSCSSVCSIVVSVVCFCVCVYVCVLSVLMTIVSFVALFSPVTSFTQTNTHRFISSIENWFGKYA